MVKISSKLLAIAFLEKGNQLVDQSGNLITEFTKPMIITEDEEGISSGLELSASVAMNTDQIADLKRQEKYGRLLIVALRMDD